MLETPVEKVGGRRDRRHNGQTAFLRKVGLYIRQGLRLNCRARSSGACWLGTSWIGIWVLPLGC